MWKIKKRISKGEYDYALVPNHPNSTKDGYVLYHRIIVENHLKRILSQDEVVHHKNSNKKDNRIENLEVLSVREHARLHGLSRGRTLVDFKCPYCKKLFTKPKRNTLDMNKGRDGKVKLYFCSKSCGTRYQFDRTRRVDVTVSENVLRIYKDYSEVTDNTQEP